MKITHNMNLNNGPFNRIKEGTKIIELRLNDEKRQLLKEKELYKHFDKIAMGYDKDDIANPKDMEKYYSKEEQDKYGVIGIEVRVIEDRK